MYKVEVPLLRTVENCLRNKRCFFMGEPQEDTMGLPGMSGLFNLGRIYKLDILGSWDSNGAAVVEEFPISHPSHRSPGLHPLL